MTVLRVEVEVLLVGEAFRGEQQCPLGPPAEEGQMANPTSILAEAERCLRSLSPERPQVASDFLAYRQECEENEATAELLSIPGFKAAFQCAVEQAGSGDVVRFEDIRRDVWD